MERELTALLICPDGNLYKAFAEAAPAAGVFQILSEVRAYSPVESLQIRVKQVRPDLVLIDVSSDLATALELIQGLVSREGIPVVALSRSNDSDALVRCLRAGASDFLYSPFIDSAQMEAAAGIRRSLKPEERKERTPGKIIAMASAKPGSGASTLAAQTAIQIRKNSGAHVLLIDCDVFGGSIGFYLKTLSPASIADALDRAWDLSDELWASMFSQSSGLDVITAPMAPPENGCNTDSLTALLEFVRRRYDWVFLDLPGVFEPISLAVLGEADLTYLVSTAELPSLHLGRKAVAMLGNLGISREQYRLLVNRVNRKDGISAADMEKIFTAPVEELFPNDYQALFRTNTNAQPLSPDSELGKAVHKLAGRISNSGSRKSGLLLDKNGSSSGSPAFSTRLA
jgi:pilus assembly protein CpaE